jgi:hypothetical protein
MRFWGTWELLVMGLPIQNNKKAESNNRRIRLLKKPAQSETTCKQLGVFWAAI